MSDAIALRAVSTFFACNHCWRFRRMSILDDGAVKISDCACGHKGDEFEDSDIRRTLLDVFPAAAVGNDVIDGVLVPTY